MKKLIAIAALAAVLVSSAFALEFNTIEDLDGKNIGVQTAVLYEELIMDRVPHSTFQYYTMPNDMILALQSGKVDAYLIEEVSYGVQKKNHPDLAVLDEVAERALRQGEYDGDEEHHSQADVDALHA